MLHIKNIQTYTNILYSTYVNTYQHVCMNAHVNFTEMPGFDDMVGWDM